MLIIIKIKKNTSNYLENSLGYNKVTFRNFLFRNVILKSIEMHEKQIFDKRKQLIKLKIHNFSV